MLKRNVWEWNSLVVAHCNSVHGWLSRNWVGWGEDTSKTLLYSFVTLFENEYEELLYTLIKLVLAHIHFCSSSYLNTRHSNMVKKRRKTVLLSSIRPSSFAVLSFPTFPAPRIRVLSVLKVWSQFPLMLLFSPPSPRSPFSHRQISSALVSPLKPFINLLIWCPRENKVCLILLFSFLKIKQDKQSLPTHPHHTW